MLKSGSKREKKPNPHPASVAAREAPADLVSEADRVSVVDPVDPVSVDPAAGEVVAAAHQASVDSEDLGSVAPAAQVVVDLVARVDLVVRESPASPVSASQPPMCKVFKTKTSTIAV
jgi:hypothetical protein